MDLSLIINDSKLNIRVAIILETPSGYIFEFINNGNFYVPIGGRIKLNEDSSQAAIREINEEIGIDMNVKVLEYIATLESFFTYDGLRFHEFNFIYQTNLLEDIKLPSGFHFIKEEHLHEHSIKPSRIVDIIKSKVKIHHHYIIND